MEAGFFEKIFQQKRMGFASLSPQLTVISHNPYFLEFLIQPGRPAQGQPLQVLIPETVGLENVLEQIAAGKQVFFQLENLQREKPGKETLFFHLSFYHTAEKAAPLFCLLEEVTATARLRQQIIQQMNEIRLLESLIAARREEISLSILGNSEPIRKIRATIEKLARVPAATILLQGESGTGKSMAARMLHHASSGKNAPFVEINCAAIPETLLESELFGYEKGAFTHAIASKQGLLEEAHGGTLFLDEIGDMSLKLQAKMLSFLETRRFRRLGSTAEKEVRLRLLASTNRDLDELVRNGAFREDLYYRLNVVKIELPPLRELGSDILEIARSYIQAFNIDFNKKITGLTAEAEQKLLRYRWPGNVRELRNAIERAMIFAEGERLDAADLLVGPAGPGPEAAPAAENFRLPAGGMSFEEIEKKLLRDALKLAGGNQSKAAKLLRLSRDAFRYRLEKHGLPDG